eukprot:UN16791
MADFEETSSFFAGKSKPHQNPPIATVLSILKPHRNFLMTMHCTGFIDLFLLILRSGSNISDIHIYSVHIAKSLSLAIAIKINENVIR